MKPIIVDARYGMELTDKHHQYFTKSDKEAMRKWEEIDKQYYHPLADHFGKDFSLRKNL